MRYFFVVDLFGLAVKYSNGKVKRFDTKKEAEEVAEEMGNAARNRGRNDLTYWVKERAADGTIKP